MAGTYKTTQGDTWDYIAYKVYGNTSYVGYLMQNNFPLLDIFRFSAGVVLNTPDLPETYAATDLPTWRVGA
jgi:phage tail protein X